MPDVTTAAQTRLAEGERAPVPLPAEVLSSLIQQAAERQSIRLGEVQPTPTVLGEAIRTLEQEQRRIGHPALEEAAVKIVQNEFGLTGSELILEARIIDSFKAPFPERVPREAPLSDPVLTRSVQHRQLVNTLIQGIAAGVQERFIYDRPEIAGVALSDELVTSSRRLLSLTDKLMWLTDERRIDFDRMPVPASSSLDFSGKLTTVRAEALHFPLLVHELAKGVAEALALHSLPEDKKLREQVLAHADRPRDESWQLRIGTSVWPLLNRLLPAEPRERNVAVQNVMCMSLGDLKNLLEYLSNRNVQQAAERLSLAGVKVRAVRLEDPR